MEEIKEIYNKMNDNDQKSNDTQTSSLVSFQCMICLNEFDDAIYRPMIICENQHNMCKKCVEHKNFKKSLILNAIQKSQKYGQFCPMCNQQVDQKKLRSNNLLLQIYSWIQKISKRQNEKIHILQKDFEHVQQEYKKNLFNLNQKNQELLLCVQVLSKQNQFLKENLNIKAPKNEQDVDEDKIVEVYENLVSELKQKINLRKIKALKAITSSNHSFEIDTLHKHFEKFKLQPKYCIQMQGPFYRAFFESLNFYYNVMPIKGFKLSEFQANQSLIKYSFQIVQTKKGHIYIGLCSKQVGYEINPSSNKNYIGFFVEDYQILHNGKRIQTKLSKLKPKSCKGLVIQIEIKKQVTLWKANGQIVFEIKTETLFETDRNVQLFPTISMQMVGDKVQIRKEI